MFSKLIDKYSSLIVYTYAAILIAGVSIIFINSKYRQDNESIKINFKQYEVANTSSQNAVWNFISKKPQTIKNMTLNNLNF